MEGQTHYPALRFMLRFGKPIAWIVATALIGQGLWLWSTGFVTWLWPTALIVAGLLSLLLLLVLRELVHIIADTLLPPE